MVGPDVEGQSVGGQKKKKEKKKVGGWRKHGGTAGMGLSERELGKMAGLGTPDECALSRAITFMRDGG